MTIRITGMNSGLDTDSIVQELVKASSAKKDKLVKKQTTLQWKQDAWSSLNAKIKKFLTKSLSDMKYGGAYNKKKTTISDSSVATVVASDSAVNGSQTLEVEKLAKAGYLTGGKLAAGTTGETTLGELGILSSSDTASLNLTAGGSTTTLELTADTTLNSFVSQLNKAGVTANFDSVNKRLFIQAKNSGEANDFELTAVNEKGFNVLSGLRLMAGDDPALDAYRNYDGSTTSALFQKEYASAKSYYENKKAQAESTVTNLNSTIDLIKKSNEKQEQNYLDTDADAFFPSAPGARDALKEVQTALGAGATDSADRKTALKDLTESTAWKQRVEDAKAVAESDDPTVTKEDKDAANQLINFSAGVEELIGNYSAEEDYQTNVTEQETKIADYQSYLDDDGGRLTSQVQDDLNAKKAAAGAVSIDPDDKTGAVRIDGQDAVIYLNGAQFTSNSNGFNVNGLTITVQDETTGPVSISTDNDVDGVYNMIKNFLTEYNSLINEMDKLYNADSAKGYEPLTDDEKAAMTDKQIEQWESKIKDASLRRDGTLNTDINLLKNNMLKGFDVGGTTYTLGSFGIATLGYLYAGENERGAYHIDGDPDDSSTSGSPDKLKKMLATDPDTVSSFFSQLATNLYDQMNESMKSDYYRSKFHMYDDKKLKSEYDSYTSQIAAAEKKLQDLEDKYYDQFSAMEVALSKLNSNSSAITGLLGG